jgi:hypothetical protein
LFLIIKYNKKAVLAYYYLNNNNIKKAENYIKGIETSTCNLICYDIEIELNIFNLS